MAINKTKNQGQDTVDNKTDNKTTENMDKPTNIEDVNGIQSRFEEQLLSFFRENTTITTSHTAPPIHPVKKTKTVGEIRKDIRKMGKSIRDIQDLLNKIKSATTPEQQQELPKELPQELLQALKDQLGNKANNLETLPETKRALQKKLQKRQRAIKKKRYNPAPKLGTITELSEIPEKKTDLAQVSLRALAIVTSLSYVMTAAFVIDGLSLLLNKKTPIFNTIKSLYDHGEITLPTEYNYRVITRLINKSPKTNQQTDNHLTRRNNTTSLTSYNITESPENTSSDLTDKIGTTHTSYTSKRNRHYNP